MRMRPRHLHRVHSSVMTRKRPDETRLEKAFRVMHEATYRFADEPSDQNRDALIAAVREKRDALRAVAALDIDIEEGKVVKPPKLDKIVEKSLFGSPVINIEVHGPSSADDVVKALESGIQEIISGNRISQEGAGSSGPPSPPSSVAASEGASAA